MQLAEAPLVGHIKEPPEGTSRLKPGLHITCNALESPGSTSRHFRTLWSIHVLELFSGHYHRSTRVL